MFNKLEKRLKHCGKSCKLDDLIQVIDIVGNLKAMYKKDYQDRIIQTKVCKINNSEEISLSRTMTPNGEITSEEISVKGAKASRLFFAGNNLKYVDMEPTITKLFMYFLLNKEKLIEISNLMQDAHKIHEKHFKAHMERKRTHEDMRRSY